METTPTPAPGLDPEPAAPVAAAPVPAPVPGYEPSEREIAREILRQRKLRKKGQMRERMKRFALEYLVDFNAYAAAKRAGYAEAASRQASGTLLKDPRVVEAIEANRARAAKRAELKIGEVLKDLAAVVRADPRELIEYHRGACRYCYGEGHRYQRTQNELLGDYAAWYRREAGELVDRGEKPTGKPFDAQGGDGFDPRKQPAHDCPECFGSGVGHTVIKDTRSLSPEAARLFAGVKQTREGIEIKTRSQDKMLELAGKYFGMFTDKVEMTGKDGAPLGGAPTLQINFVTPGSTT